MCSHVPQSGNSLALWPLINVLSYARTISLLINFSQLGLELVDPPVLMVTLLTTKPRVVFKDANKLSLSTTKTIDQARV